MEILLFIFILTYIATIASINIAYKLNTKNMEIAKKEQILDRTIQRVEEKEKKLIRPQAPHTDYETLMRIIDESIDREFKVAYLLDLGLNDKVIVADFEKDLENLVKGVMSSFTMTFLDEVSYYHDVKYVITYVTRILKIKLMRLIREKKVGIR